MLALNRNIITSLCVGLITIKAYAGGGGITGGSTEITQLLNNAQLIMQLSESEQQTVTQIKQLYEQIQQAEREIRHLQQIGNDVVKVTQIAKEADLIRLKEAIRRTERIHGNVSTIQDRLEKRIQEAYQKGQTLGQYVEQETQKIQRNEVRAVARVQEERAMIDTLQEDYTAIQKLSNQIGTTNGSQQSLGLMNTQLNHALVSLNRISQIMQASQDNMNKANQEGDEIVRAKREEDFRNSINERNKSQKSQSLNGFDATSHKRLSSANENK